ncbi:hypothetical protein BBJ28_00014072 [Nothophytophthora sp. Chile5]|nr:hypothetical protein BBJ28_00014072 [Nothophytophthora sp. Chile5]
MHTTGTKGAVHSGLSIDDGNAIFQRMEGRKLVKESRMDTWFMTMDRLDRDDVGLLDKQLSRCLERFLGLQSAFYGRLEMSGEDPHQRLLVFGGSGGSATQQALLLEKISRECFGPNKCSCLEDAEPWEGFSLKPGDALAHKLANGAARAAGASESDDVGILAIKRQWGFEDLTHDKGTEADDDALAREAAELTKRRKARGQRSTFGGGARPTATARSIYQKKCEENGTKPKPQIEAILAVKNGALQLNLSQFGFYSADDLQDLVDVFSCVDSSDLPPVQELDVANGFFNASAFEALGKLLRVPQLRQSVERVSLRSLALPQRTSFAEVLRLLTGSIDSSPGTLPALSQLKTLDLSYNTLWHDGAEQLKFLLASLLRLENLSLESCFPLPVLPAAALSSSSDEESSKTDDLVHTVLIDASNRLVTLNFDSNFIRERPRWLDALFTPESSLLEVSLSGMSTSTTSTQTSSEASGGMEVDWLVSDTWDVQHLQVLKWSCSNAMHSKKLLDAVSSGLQAGFAQLKHLEVEIDFTHDTDNGGDERRMNRKVTDMIGHIADYGALRSCSLHVHAESDTSLYALRAPTRRLLADGLRECETLTLRMPQMRLTAAEIHDLLSCAVVPKLQKMNLVVGLASGGAEECSFASCFQRDRMASIRDLTLDLCSPVEDLSSPTTTQPSAGTTIARELEAAWLALDPLQTQDKGKSGSIKQAFVLSQPHAARQRPNQPTIYRCRFSACPAPESRNAP